MNADTLVTICCRAEDETLLMRHMPMYKHHECPILVISPVDSVVIVPGCLNISAGRAGYIGAIALDRFVNQLQAIAFQPQTWHLMCDADSFCRVPQLPSKIYVPDVVWSNEIIEPRPHASPYPKIAMHCPYFFHRDTVRALLVAIPNILPHPITPYIDWFILAMTCEARLRHRSFSELENPAWTGARSQPSIEQMLFPHPVKL